MARKEGRRNLSIPMTDGDIKRVHEIARSRGFKITADYVRTLIMLDAQQHGEKIDFEVNRGGYRGDRDDLEE